MATGATYRFTKRVAARKALGQRLQEPDCADAVKREGLLPGDLQEIVTTGEDAERYDRQQQEEIVAKRLAQKEHIALREETEEQIERLRNRLPAVAADLIADPATAPHAAWLAQISFDLYRVRLVTPPKPEGTAGAGEGAAGAAGATAGAAEGAARERVVKSDIYSRFLSTAQLVSSLLEPAREVVVAALASRGMDRAQIEALGKGARQLAEVEGSPAQLTAAEATRLEAEAVATQAARWKACRRMIRAVVAEKGDLKALFAAC